MSLRYYILILFFISSFNVLTAQQSNCPPIQDERLERLFAEAVDHYKSFRYRRALSLLFEINRQEPDYAPAHYLLGLIYVNERNFRPNLAKGHFEKTLDICPEIDPYLYYHLGEIYFLNGVFDKSANMYEKFISYIDEISDDDYFKAVENLEQAKFLHEGYSNPVPFNPVPVRRISTENDEYLITISADGQVALFTRRVKIKDQFSPWDTHANYKELFMQSFRINDNAFEEGEPLPPPFNTQMHEGSPSLTYDNRTMYFTACEFEKEYYNCNIHVSHNINGMYWSKSTKLPETVNSTDAWESQPSISPDGKTLYFVSDRNGRYDIFVTRKDDDENWQPAEDLGSPINSSGNERSPFIHIDGKTLYFSSDGHLGFGGYDLFFSKMQDDNSWGKPKNLGYPINTAADETGLYVSTDGADAYFGSTRFNDNEEWNIYTFELYEKARPEKVLFITGEVENEDSTSLNDVQLQLRNLATQETKDIEVDSLTGKYAIAELFDKDFLLTLKKENFAYNSRLLLSEDTLLNSPAKVDLDLVPVEVGQKYEIQDIYFDYDKYELKKESKIVLYTHVEFLNDHPDIKLEIRGHTDNIGGQEYNQTLSENRAKAVYDFFVENNISPNRLSYKGFGQIDPVDTNETAEGRANNRRTEFVIVSK